MQWADLGVGLYVRVRGASMRLRAGFTMDPTPARGPGSRSFPFRVQSLQSFAGLAAPGREIPRAPQTRSPRLQKRRGRNGRTAIGGSGGSNGRQGRRLRPSGCDRPRLREPMRMRGTRHARYLQTLPQPYSYAEYVYADILYCSLSNAEYAYADIT